MNAFAMRQLAILLLWGIVLVLGLGRAHAQKLDSATIIQSTNASFQQLSSYFNYQTQVSAPIFGEVHYYTNPERAGIDSLVRYLSTASVQVYWPLFRSERFGTNLQIWFNPVLRMFNARSFPIRTPSFHIGILGRTRLTKPQDWNPSVGVYSLEYNVVHHSNGQDGLVLTNNAAGQRVLNTYNGSFATHYSDLFLVKTKVSADQQHLSQWKAGFQLHHNVGVRYDHFQSNYYGRYRIAGEYQHIWRKPSPMATYTTGGKPVTYWRDDWRLLLRAHYLFNPMWYRNTDFYVPYYQPRRVNVEAELHKSLGSKTGFNAFVAIGLTGHDDYNIYYDRGYVFSRFGLSLTLNRAVVE